MITNINTGIHTASANSSNNSNDAPPTTPTTESLLGTLSQRDRVIYERNNIRLRQMEAEVRQLATYGGACDELLEWLSDARAYNPYNEKALLGCINAIFEKAQEYGPWSGLEILKEANQRCGNGLSEKGKACVRKCYEDLHNLVTGRRPSNASVVSNASTSHPSPASLTSTRSAAHVNIPGSPTTNNSFNQLAKLLDASVFPQSPNSNMGSPMSSPQFRGMDVSAPQIAPNQPVVNNAPVNNSHLNAYIQQRLAQAKQQEQQQQQQQPQPQYQQPYQYPYQYPPHQPQQAQHIPQINQQHLNPAQFQQVQQMYHDQLRRVQFEEQQRRAQEEQQRRALEEQQRRVQEEEQRKAKEAEQNRIARAQEVQRQKAQFEHQQRLLKQQQAQKQQQYLQQQLQQQRINDDEQQALARQYLQVLTQNSNNAMPQSFSLSSAAAHLQNSASMAASNNHVSAVQLQQQPQQQTLPANKYPVSTANTPTSAVAPTVISPVPLTSRAAPATNAIVPAVAATTTTTTTTSIIPSNLQQPPVQTRSLPMNTDAAASKPSAVATTPTTPTTPNMPLRAAPVNTSTSSYTSPSLVSTVDISKIHLPSGGNVHRPAVPVVIPATTSTYEWTRPKGQGDKIEYLFKDRHAFPAFRLAHGEMITRVPFHIGKEEYSKLFKHSNTTLKDYRGEPPLSFFITAWYEGTQERKCDWPTGVRIELNARNLALQKREKITNPNGGPSIITGKDRPFDMTRLLSLNKNMLIIHQPKCACNSKKSYLFAVQVYKRYSENYILNSVKNKEISIETSERLIDNLLGKNRADDNDDDVIVLQKSIKLTLKCPLGFKKIKQPVRGVDCKHVDCFDLDTYLMVNKIENPTWVCPHCNKQVGPTALARDLLVEKLLDTLPKRASEIEYTNDHTKYTITRMEDPDTDDEDDDEDEDRDGADADDGNQAKAKHEPLASNDNVIDLISDDEDEDNQGTTSTTTNSNIPSKRSWEA